MSAAFAGSATAAANDVTYEDESGDESTLFFQGQNVTASGDKITGTQKYQLRSVDSYGDSGQSIASSTFEEEVAADGGEIVVETDDYETGDYFLRGHGIEESIDNTYEVTIQNLDVSWDEDSVENEGSNSEVDIEFDSRRSDYAVNASASGLDVEDLNRIFESNSGTDFVVAQNYTDEDIVELTDPDGEGTANFSRIDADEYDFTFNVTDTTATDTATINVSEGEDASRSLSSSSAQVGDTAAIPVDTDGTDSSVMQIGEHEETNYEVGLNITSEDYDEDQFYLAMNSLWAAQPTANAGAPVNAEEAGAVFAPVDAEGETIDDIDVEVAYANISEDTENNFTDSRLGSGEYLLTVGDSWNNGAPVDTDIGSGNGTIADEQDSSYLLLSEFSGIGDVATHTAPGGDSLGDMDDFEDTTVTETSTVAEDDHLLVTVDDLGMTGAFFGADNGDAATGSLASAGVDVKLEQENPGTNRDPQILNLTGANGDVTGNIYVDAVNADDYSGDQLILRVDDQDDEIKWSDEDYEVNVTVQDESNYLDDDEEVSSATSVSLEERDLDWDDSAEEVPAIDGATADGSTNVAPGTELNTRARSSGNFVENDDPVVMEEDGNRYFSAEFDFGEYEADTEFDLRVRDTSTANSADEVEIDSVLIEGGEAQPFNYDVSTSPSDPVVGDDVTGTIDVENTNEMTASEDVMFTFNGDTVVDETAELEAGASDTLVDGATLLENASAGDYEWELTADGEVVADGTLTVEDPDKGDGEDGTDGEDGSDGDDGSDGEDGSDGDDGSDGEDGDDGSDGGDDGTPGFGVGVALVALLGAAMLALRRQN